MTNKLGKIFGAITVGAMLVAIPSLSSATTFTKPILISQVGVSQAGLNVVESVGDFLWAATLNSRKVVKISKATGLVDSTYDLQAEATGNVMKSSVDENYLWLSHYSAGVSRVSLADGTTAYFSSGLEVNRDIVSDGTFVWVTANIADKVIKLNAATGAFISATTLNNPMNIDTDGTNVYVTYDDGQKFAKLDRDTGTSIFENKPTGIPTTGGWQSTDLKVSGTSVFVSANGGLKVFELSAATGGSVSELSNSGNVGALVIYGNMLWIMNVGATTSYQFDLYLRSAGVPTRVDVGGFVHGGSGKRNAVYDGTNLWSTDTDGKLYKYSAQSYGLITTPGQPGTPTVTAGDGQATVTISAPTTGGAPATYLVTASPDGATCTVTAPAAFCIVSGLTNGTSYTFSSTATNTAGTSVPSESSVAVTPVASPLIPSAPGKPIATAGDGTATLSWTASGSGTAPITYSVTSAPAGASCVVSSLTSSCTGLTNGTAYTFTVKASNVAGDTNSLASDSVIPAITPITPVPTSGGGSPVVIEVTPKKVTVSNEIVTLFGAGLQAFTGATVNGKPVRIVQITPNRITFIAPAGLTGTHDITLTGSSRTLLVRKGLTYGSAVMKGARTVVPGFAANSTRLTKEMRQEVRAFLRANPGLNDVVCKGFTSAPATAQDRILARDRGKIMCGLIKKLRPEATVTLRSGSHTDTPGLKIRRVQITLR